MQGHANSGPLRYLERIKVDKVTLGKRAPLLSSCTASTGAPAGCVRLALPFTFEPTEGFSVVVSTRHCLLLHSGVQAEHVAKTTLSYQDGADVLSRCICAV